MKSSVPSPLLLNCQFPSKAKYLAELTRALDRKTLTHIVTLNAEMIVEAQKNIAFRNAIQQAELQIPDGSSILWAKKYLEQKKHLLMSLLTFLFSSEQPLTGVDSIFDICSILEKKKGSIYLLGGTQEQAQGTFRVLQKKYPTLHVYITTENIQKSGTPAAILVAYGAPKQTLWIEENRAILEKAGVSIAIGVGGAFTMISGILPRAPKILRRFHLEWLWRLMLEPKRIKRIWNAVVVFPFIVRGYPH